MDGKKPPPQLGDGQLDVARRGRDQLRAVPVALRHAGLAALLRPAPIVAVNSASISSQHPGQTGADLLGHLARLDSGEEVGQVRLGVGHRRGLLRVIPARNTSSITPVAHPTVDPQSQLHHVKGHDPAEAWESALVTVRDRVGRRSAGYGYRVRRRHGNRVGGRGWVPDHPETAERAAGGARRRPYNRLGADIPGTAQREPNGG